MTLCKTEAKEEESKINDTLFIMLHKYTGFMKQNLQANLSQQVN